MAASLRAALVSRGSLRLAIAIACVGLCARWLPGSSALAGLLFVDHGWVTESVAERIDDVARFLGVTRAQFIITTPTTHNLLVYNPARLTLNLRKKAANERHAPVPTFLRR